MAITDTVAPDPGGGRNYRLAVSLVSSPQTPGISDGARPDAGPAAVPRPDGVMTPPLAVPVTAGRHSSGASRPAP